MSQPATNNKDNSFRFLSKTVTILKKSITLFCILFYLTQLSNSSYKEKMQTIFYAVELCRHSLELVKEGTCKNK